MKKLFIFILFISLSAVCFAKTIYDGECEKMLDSFFQKGVVVKIYEDANNVQYINKTFITSIAIDEDDFIIQCYPTEDFIMGLG